MHCSAEEGIQRSLQSGAEQLVSSVGSLDSRADKQRFLEAHHAAFMIPKKFEFQGQRGDEVKDDFSPRSNGFVPCFDCLGRNVSGNCGVIARKARTGRFIGTKECEKMHIFSSFVFPFLLKLH